MSAIFLEAESFKNLGGWVIDQQSMQSLHSSYIMAHGLGVRVEDAETEFEADSVGEYSVWVYTRDWTSAWCDKSAGKFKVVIDDKELEGVLGTNGFEWSWQYAGKITMSAGRHTIKLRDLTGFNGRCDAVYITTGDKPGDIDCLRKNLNWKEVRDYNEEFDLIVVGGGVAGVCLAISAMRTGAKTLLLHDRGVLGGCNSSEVRVCMGGQINLPPYERLGDVVKEIAPVVGYPDTYDAECFEDSRKKLAFEVRETKGIYKVILNECVTEVEKNSNRIAAVISTNTVTGKKTRFRAGLFADCTGDAVVARKAGAVLMYGREARSEFNESLAPETQENLVMGHSVRWYSQKSAEPTGFPDIKWGIEFTEDTCYHVLSGDWEQETGFRRDMADDTEYIRDYGLRAVYGNWAYQKNHSRKKEDYRFDTLKWVSPLGGKRESYRVVGDIVLTQNDIEDRIIYDDGTACMTWSIDMHFPEPDNEKAFGEAFRSFAYHRGIEKPYPVPYRCLYSKDIDNLFLGGRIVSMSHVAFSAVRVMRTLGALGEAAGLAAGICVKNQCMPREVYTEHLEELKSCMKEGVPVKQAFQCNVGSEEAYHFKDIGWLYLNPYHCDLPNELEKFKRNISKLGLTHKNKLPKELA